MSSPLIDQLIALKQSAEIPSGNNLVCYSRQEFLAVLDKLMVSAREQAAQLKLATEARQLIQSLMLDYDHAWPNEDVHDRNYRERKFGEMKSMRDTLAAIAAKEGK